MGVVVVAMVDREICGHMEIRYDCDLCLMHVGVQEPVSSCVVSICAD